MHEHFEDIESDDHFVSGELKYLVAGNEGRVLDGRRTPGYIESYNPETAMFIWRITAFEDEGKFWEIPAEEICCYQFKKGCVCLSQKETDAISKRCELYSEQINISADINRYEITREKISDYEAIAEKWLKENSQFIAEGKKPDFSSATGDRSLYSDLSLFMEKMGVLELEQKTAEQYLLNPYSGEWMKAMKIVMAEMGLIDYAGKVMRGKSAFEGAGAKDKRERYIMVRLAFLRAFFKLNGICEVPLYRGVSSEADFFKTPDSILSCTFNSNTAKEFASIENSEHFRSCYWVKFICPVEKIFMTYFETKEFNERYQEQECIVFYQNKAWF